MRCCCRALLAACLVLLATTPAPASPGPETVADRGGALLDNPVFDSRVYVEKTGDPQHPPVVLVHGLGGDSAHSWGRIADRLDERHHVVILDLPGFGRSAPATGALSPENYARLLHWVIEREGLEDVHLVGHSMGGAIALEYAAAHPERLRNLTLVGSVGVLHRAAYVKALLARSLQLPTLPAPFERPAREMSGALQGLLQEFSALPTLSEFIRSDGLLVDLLGKPATVTAALTLMERDFSPAVASLSVPSTIVWGGEDRIAPMRSAHLLHGRLADSQLHVLPNAGHVPMADDPVAFRAALASALAHAGGAAKPRPEQAGQEDYHCDGGIDETVSGSFDLIVIGDCLGVELVDVRARRIEIRDSTVNLRNVRVDAKGTGPALAINRSSVTATNLEARGDPAIAIEASHLDAASATFHAPDAAIVVGAESDFILSVSVLRSGLYAGYLHGTVEAANTELDHVRAVRSVAGQQAAVEPSSNGRRTELLAMATAGREGTRLVRRRLRAPRPGPRSEAAR